LVTNRCGPPVSSTGAALAAGDAAGGAVRSPPHATSAPSAMRPASRRRPGPRTLLQRERVERVARADHDVLLAVEQERLRAVGRVGAQAGAPERLARGG